MKHLIEKWRKEAAEFEAEGTASHHDWHEGNAQALRECADELEEWCKLEDGIEKERNNAMELAETFRDEWWSLFLGDKSLGKPALPWEK